MATQFFERQEKARKQTGRLLFLYALAVVGIIAAVYALSRVLGAQFLGIKGGFLHLPMLAGVVAGTLLVIGGGVLIAFMEFRRGGSAVAESLGGRLISPDTRDPQERMLLNVVEEMSIASGVPVPPVYLMDNETGINAFAAGWSLGDAAIGVTRGALELLDRDELQAVMAHEYSHILNGDMRLNLHLMGWLQGILGLALLGQILFRTLSFRRSRSDRDSGQIVIFIVAAGVGLWITGSIGVLFARLIQAAVSRQREHLADASAVQFTRNPKGLSQALLKIAGLAQGSKIQHPRALEAGHFFFSNSFSKSNFQSWFSTHPPLKERIQLLDPAFDGNIPAISAESVRRATPSEGVSPSRSGSGRPSQAPPIMPRIPGMPHLPGMPHMAQAAVSGLIDQAGEMDPEHLNAAQAWRENLNPDLVMACHDSLGAEVVIFALLLDSSSDIRQKQLGMLPETAQAELATILPIIQALSAFDRLPVAELALTGLRQLSPSQQSAFLQSLDRLVAADGRIDLFEMALRKMVNRRLAQWGGVRRRPPSSGVPPMTRAAALQVLLSGLAYSGQGGEAAAADRAFEAGWSKLPNLPTASLLPPVECTVGHLDRALDTLEREAPLLKRRILDAALESVSTDGQLTAREAEVVRAVADTLDCPLPPWLAFPTGPTGV